MPLKRPARPVVLATLWLFAAACQPGFDSDQPITLSVIGTNDVHGSLLSVDGNRGLTLFSGYVDNLRATREADGGVVLLIDAGDMWQGTLESNQSEGATVVAAYNAMAYDAATVGNHEFDFGPVGPRATPADNDDDPRGALKHRASEMRFPLLAANIIDLQTGELVDWPNVRPSVLIRRAGVRVGIIGLISKEALVTTMAQNVHGLDVAPLADAAIREARKLREAGAELVIITAHAGSSCEEFDDPLDLSSCDLDGEIMQLARDLPAGLVDQIVAGHVHRGIAHEVNGVAITSSYSSTRAFGRVDYVLNRVDHSLVSRRIFPPQPICGFVDNSTGLCVPATDATGATDVAQYSGRVVTPNAGVLEIAENAARQASALKSQPLGVYLESPVTREGRSNSLIGHLLTDVVFDMMGGDVVIHNVVGGIRADLPAGPLTYGAVYEIFPFDNLAIQVDLTGAELRQVLRRQVFNPDRRAGVAGIRIFASCSADDLLELTMRRADGSEITDDDVLVVTMTDFLATGGDDIITPVIPENGFDMAGDAPLMREVIVDWMHAHPGSLDPQRFSDAAKPRWNLPDPMPPACSL